MVFQLVIEHKDTLEQEDIRFFDTMGKARRAAYDKLESGYNWELNWQWLDAKQSWVATSDVYRFTILLIEVE